MIGGRQRPISGGGPASLALVPCRTEDIADCRALVCRHLAGDTVGSWWRCIRGRGCSASCNCPIRSALAVVPVVERVLRSRSPLEHASPDRAIGTRSRRPTRRPSVLAFSTGIRPDWTATVDGTIEMADPHRRAKPLEDFGRRASRTLRESHLGDLISHMRTMSE